MLLGCANDHSCRKHVNIPITIKHSSLEQSGDGWSQLWRFFAITTQLLVRRAHIKLQWCLSVQLLLLVLLLLLLFMTLVILRDKVYGRGVTSPTCLVALATKLRNFSYNRQLPLYSLYARVDNDSCIPWRLNYDWEFTMCIVSSRWRPLQQWRSFVCSNARFHQRNPLRKTAISINWVYTINSVDKQEKMFILN